MLFLGDYVDRGAYCLEVCLYLFCLKVSTILSLFNVILSQVNYPKEVAMLRGNHEARQMVEHYTFMKEVVDKHDS